MHITISGLLFIAGAAYILGCGEFKKGFYRLIVLQFVVSMLILLGYAALIIYAIIYKI